MRTTFFLTLAVAALISHNAAAQLRIQLPLPLGGNEGSQQTVDLGKRTAGQTYSFNMSGRNSSCDQPLDFSFNAENADWLRFPSGNIVKGVAMGQTKPLAALLDFSQTKPGHYTGQVEVSCENCGWFIFANCQIDKQVLQFNVDVVPAENAQQVANSNPQPKQQSPADYNDQYKAPPGNDVPYLPGHYREDLAIDANAISTATAKLTAAQAKKRKCDEDLVGLKAAADRAAAAAAQAHAEADAADAAAKAAERQLAGYQKDLAAAEKAMNNAYRTLQMQAAYRSIVRKEDGTGSARYADADNLVNKANDAVHAAEAKYTAIKSSLAARKASAQQARAEANAKKQAAAKADRDAAAAKAAYEAKARECGLLKEAAAAAERAKAKADAKAAADKAAAQAAKDDAKKKALAAAQARHQAIIAEKRHLAHIQTEAFKALKTLGVFSRAKNKDLNIESMVEEWVAETAAECVAAHLEIIPTFQVFTALSALQASYGLVNLRQQQLTPSRGGYLGDDYLAAWLQKHEYAKDPKEAGEIVKVMTGVMEHGGNLDYLKADWERLMRACCQAGADVKAIEADHR